MTDDRNFHATVNIVTWNSEKYIKDLLESLKAQTFRGFRIIIVDNASTDGTLDIARAYENVALIKNSGNIGFARAHNKGIEMAMKFWEKKNLNERFAIICNPDIVLKENCLEELLKDIWRDKNAGLAGPKLLRIHEEEKNNFLESAKTDIIDSLGLKIAKSGRVIDIAAGRKDGGAPPERNIFGASGALMCVRAEALREIKCGGEYFDENFFAYKEDVDLCWRMRNLGWSIILSPAAIAYHHRRVGGNVKKSFWQKLSYERRKPKIIKFLSVRNHLWLMAKNNFYINFLLYSPFIFFEECAKFLYCLFFNFSALRAYFAAIGGLPKMLKKRRYLKNAKVGPADIRKWMK